VRGPVTCPFNGFKVFFSFPDSSEKCMKSPGIIIPIWRSCMRLCMIHRIFQLITHIPVDNYCFCVFIDLNKGIPSEYWGITIPGKIIGEVEAKKVMSKVLSTRLHASSGHDREDCLSRCERDVIIQNHT